MIVGVYGDPFPSLVSALQIVQRIDGTVSSTTQYSDNGIPVPPAPIEVPFLNLPEGSLVTASITPEYVDCSGYTRTASTTIVAGKTLLLRAPLFTSCYSCDEGTYCPAYLTCAGQFCINPLIPPSTLAEYTPDWSTHSACNPPMSGPPAILLGQGPSGFSPLVNGDTIQLQAGGQGGNHVWVAMRAQNIGSSGTIRLQGTLTNFGVSTIPLSYNVALAEEVGSGYCEYWTFRIQIDDLVPNPPTDLFGQPLLIDVTYTDTNGVAANAQKQVVVSNSL